MIELSEDTKELNEAMNRFRQASSDLRKHFSAASDFRGHEHNISEGWDEIQKLLFDRLVCFPCALEHFEYGKAHQGIEVKPKYLPIGLFAGSNSECFSSSDFVLLFRDYFIPAEKECVSFKILKSAEFPELEGKNGFVEVDKVYYEFRNVESTADT
ncbi:MAG: hypothetical protein IPG59_20925 [Candidatus Melainabacteria bacterium]|nr:MAG: hypothetical protein IPG59_20925 [Candidatus Melainabacteria bacterium]